MDNENQSSSQENSGGGSKKWVWIAVVAAIVIIALAAGGYMLTKNQSTTAENTTPSVNGNEDTAQPTTAAPTAVPSKSTYKDGTYTAIGKYVTHGGGEQITVKLTVKDGVVTSADVVTQAKLPMSKIMQQDFADHYKVLVVGKDLDTLKLGKVSGSSLTPQGFNAAIEDIRTQAQG